MAALKPWGKSGKLILGIILIGGIGMQWIRPELKNPPVTKDLTAPENVKVILERACYDCHSNQTKLKWFDEIAPAYWIVSEDVKKARKVLNFSHWDSLAPGDQKGKLFEAFNQLSLGAMPLPQYSALHPESKLTSEDMAILKKYIGNLAPVKTSDISKINTAELQYNEWRMNPTKPKQIKPTINGIDYIPDFRNWKAISTSDRFDNETMRVILGNDVAVKAIKEQKINPWPNGAIFAKVAWDQIVDSLGQVRTGEFKQVEFMIKDDEKYKNTAGWGWARWKGMQLTPYGRTESFTIECINCHNPVKDNDFVFTLPLHLKSK